MDFAVFSDYLVTCATDFRVKIFKFQVSEPVCSTLVEGLPIALCVYESAIVRNDIQLDRLGKDFTYLAVGMLTSTIVFVFDLRYHKMVYYMTLLDSYNNVGGNLL